MKTGLLILLAFILSSITSVEAQERKNGKTMEKEERPLQAGDRCPNFSFEDIDGNFKIFKREVYFYRYLGNMVPSVS